MTDALGYDLRGDACNTEIIRADDWLFGLVPRAPEHHRYANTKSGMRQRERGKGQAALNTFLFNTGHGISPKSRGELHF